MAIIDSTLGANWSANSLGYLPPIRGGLQFWYNFGGSAAATVVDQSPYKRNASFVGSSNYLSLATFNTGYATLNNNTASSTNYVQMQTQFVDTNSSDITFLLVIRSTDTFATSSSQPVFINNYGADASNPYTGTKGTTLAVSATTGAPQATIRLADNFGGTIPANTNTFLSTSIPSAANFNTNFKVVVSTAQTTGGNTTRYIYDLTDAISANATTASPRVTNITKPYVFGSNTNTYTGGVFDIMIGAAWSRCLSGTEINSILYPAVQRYAAQYSISV